MKHCSCIVCNSKEYVLYDKIKDNNNNEFILVKCRCGFVYLNPQLPESEIGKYYNVSNYLPHTSKINLISAIYKIVQQLTMRWKLSLIRKYKKDINNLLDIGGGKGEFVSFINKQHICAFNDEPFLKNNKFSINANKEKLKFDIITMWHSLEHIYDVSYLFETINNVLEDNGYIIIAVPNFDAIERRKFFKKNWIAYDLPRHLYHFNYKTFGAFMNKKGYKIINSHTMFQDTMFNIFFSFKGYNLLKLAGVMLSSLIAIFFDKRVSSSLVYICQKQQ